MASSTSSAMTSSSSSHIRIITTLGHVDHGKTTLMDSLLAANNIISARMAGQMRYMDSREDEQERGITMESSAVSLRFQVVNRGADGAPLPITYSINLIDTPGHVDFSSEVSTASRLCDGALVLIDVIEGVCTQTIAVLRQAWVDRLKPILVINKFDRLITELRLTPMEAYAHLSRVIEDVNAVMGGFFAGERMMDDLKWREERERRINERKERQAEETDAAQQDDHAYEETDDSDIYFAPERGNVIFASALGGWGFRVGKFAAFSAAKLGMSEANLRKVLWGDYYFDPKTKRVIGARHLKGRALKPLFVQIVLENIWAVYDTILKPAENGEAMDTEKLDKIVSRLGVKIPPRDLRSKDAKHLLGLIMGGWLPLAPCVIQAVIDVVPPPQQAQGLRVPDMLHLEREGRERKDTKQENKIERDLCTANSGPDAGVCGYVSKMFAVRRADLPKPVTKENGNAGQTKAVSTEGAARAGGGPTIRPRPAFVPRPRPGASTSDLTTTSTTSTESSGATTPVTNGDASTTAEESSESASSPAEAISTSTDSASDESDEVLLGFARLYSGTLRVGNQVVAVLPKFNPALENRTKHRSEPSASNPPSSELRIPKTHSSNTPHLSAHPLTINALYTMMGRALVPVSQVKAGEIFAVGGLEGVVGRCGTICSPPSNGVEGSEWLINLGRVGAAPPPIVRVALEPALPADMSALLRGLRVLSASDPCVEVYQQNTGEWVVGTAGELHLERCLKDLRERFARVEIHVSKPIVPFRETAVRPVLNVGALEPQQSFQSQPSAPSKTIGTISSSSSQSIVRFTVRAVPLPPLLQEFLAKNGSVARKMQGIVSAERKNNEADANADLGAALEGLDLSAASPESINTKDNADVDVRTPEQFFDKLQKICDKLKNGKGSDKSASGDRELWIDIAERVWAFGPQNAGSASDTGSSIGGAGAGCLLIDTRKDTVVQSLRRRLHSRSSVQDSAAATASQDEANSSSAQRKTLPSFDSHIETGFQLATFQGPLCAEPVEGLAFFVEKVEVDEEKLEGEIAQNRVTQVTGSLISAVRDACRNALLEWSPRLMLAMYSCDIQCSTDVLGKVYGVVAKRKGRIVAEEMKEGTSFFTVSALLPVVESFGFSDDIRKRTSGAASPQLIFSGYEMLDQDPFWVPTTEEELEDLGEKADRLNIAKGYVDAVRERKGMFVDRKLVEHAEKQRTLKK